MPLYEYQCEACAHRFERIQKYSDPPIDTCPVCGAAVKKLISSPAIQFKGSGFYITDYAKKPSSDSSKGSSSSGTSSTSESGTASSSSSSSSTNTGSGTGGGSSTSGSSGSSKSGSSDS